MMIKDRRLEKEQDVDNFKMLVYFKNTCRIPCTIIKFFKGQESSEGNWDYKLKEVKVSSKQDVQNCFTIENDISILMLKEVFHFYDGDLNLIQECSVIKDISPCIEWVYNFKDDFNSKSTTGFIMSTEVQTDDHEKDEEDDEDAHSEL